MCALAQILSGSCSREESTYSALRQQNVCLPQAPLQWSGSELGPKVSLASTQSPEWHCGGGDRDFKGEAQQRALGHYLVACPMRGVWNPSLFSVQFLVTELAVFALP